MGVGRKNGFCSRRVSPSIATVRSASRLTNPSSSCTTFHTLDMHGSPDLGLLASAAVVFGAQRLVPTYDNTWYKAIKKPE